MRERRTGDVVDLGATPDMGQASYNRSLMRNDLNKKSIKCVGKKGTIHIHSGNVIHRLNPVKGSQRLALHLEFSPGSNILLDSSKIFKSLKSGFNLNDLSEEKREVLKGIFPKKLFKGYEIKGDSISPNKFKGI